MALNFKKISTHYGLRKYFFNATWLFFNHGVRLFVGFFVGLWLARYLGPEKFGLYNYVISFSAVFMALARFGTEELLIKEFLSTSQNYVKALSDSFWLRVYSGVASFILLCLFVFGLEESITERNLILIASIPLIFQSFEVLDSFFRAKVQAKTAALSRSLQLIISAGVKIYLIVTQAPLTYFIYVIGFDSITYGIFIYSAYRVKNDSFIRKMPDHKQIFILLKKAWPLMISAVSVALLAKFDQIMISTKIGNEQLGMYAASVKVIEILTLIPSLLSSSLFPAIINAKAKSEKSYLNRLKKLNILVFWGSLLISLSIYFFSTRVINILYTSQFDDSYDVLKILIFNFVFLAQSFVSMRWYITENLQRFFMYKTVSGSVLNIGLNIWFIPLWGIEGAAIAALVSGFYLSFIFDLLFKETRPCFYISLSFLNPKNYMK